MGGCVRDIRIGGQEVDLENNIKTAGLVPCNNHPCGKRYCKNGGECRVSKGTHKTICHCKQRFRGKRCQKRKKVLIGSKKLFRTGVFGSKNLLNRRVRRKQNSFSNSKKKKRNKRGKRKRKPRGK